MINSFFKSFYLFFAGFLLIAPVLTMAQQDTAVSYTEIVSVDSADASRLFERARIWMLNSYWDFKVELKVQDRDYGHLGGDGMCIGVQDHKDTKMFFNSNTTFRFTIDIWTVNGKYRYAITGIYDELGDLLTTSTRSPIKYPLTGQQKSDRFWAATKKAFDRKIRERIESLKFYMAGSD